MACKKWLLLEKRSSLLFDHRGYIWRTLITVNMPEKIINGTYIE